MAKRVRTRSYKQHVATARRQLEKPVVKAPARIGPMPEFVVQDVALFAHGYSVAQIARTTGRTRQAVEQSLRLAALSRK